MFRCEVTGVQSKEGEKPHRLVVETRPRQYRHWDREAEEEWFSNGSEVVREVIASDEGLRLWNSWSDEDRAAFAKGL